MTLRKSTTRVLILMNTSSVWWSSFLSFSVPLAS